MKAVILAGGLGTRIAEETGVKPKPMVEVGGKPILWHVMKIYLAHGIDDFIICCGHKGYQIKEYFASYALRTSDVTFDMRTKETKTHQERAEPWRVTLIDTGEHTLTGGRLKRVREHVGHETFCFTYGDGVGDVNITELIRFHREKKALVTMTATQPPGRFGAFSLAAEDEFVSQFREKPRGDGSWVNGGFFVVEPEAIGTIAGDDTTWEQEPLQLLAQRGQLAAYRHTGFWQPMDTLRDKNLLEQVWASGRAPWKVWE